MRNEEYFATKTLRHEGTKDTINYFSLGVIGLGIYCWKKYQKYLCCHSEESVKSRIRSSEA